VAAQEQPVSPLSADASSRQQPFQHGGAPLRIVLASSNAGKLAELQALLARLPIRLVTAREALGHPLDLEETAATFEANARQKAKAVCEATGMISLADDSGLEVDALGGRPGVYSARFAGQYATDEQNNVKLLRELDPFTDDARSARFRCVLALASPCERRTILAEGVCEGMIARAARGSAGFGYDPLFVPAELAPRTMAELSSEEKNRISHRSRAVRALIPGLLELLGQTPAQPHG
jgi:XTP/dITP diphosphohydrolase